MRVMDRSEMMRLDHRVRQNIREHLKKAWDEQYGLSEEDVLGAAAMQDWIYLEYTELPASECSDRALDIAFNERDKLYDERI